MGQKKKQWWLLLVAFGCGAACALVVAISAFEPNQTHDVVQTLPASTIHRLLISQARDAAARDARPEAEVLAVAAMGWGSEVEARSLLAGLGSAQRLQLQHQHALEGCHRTSLSKTGRYFYCWREDTVHV